MIALVIGLEMRNYGRKIGWWDGNTPVGTRRDRLEIGGFEDIMGVFVSLYRTQVGQFGFDLFSVLRIF